LVFEAPRQISGLGSSALRTMVYYVIFHIIRQGGATAKQYCPSSSAVARKHPPVGILAETLTGLPFIDHLVF
jgi:hypothetical protein